MPDDFPMDDFPATPTTREPVHPGAILREVVLPALEIDVKSAANLLGVSRQHLHDILAERADVSSDMAVRLGKFCGNGPHLWLAMQGALNLWHSTQKLRDALTAIPTMRAKGDLEPA